MIGRTVLFWDGREERPAIVMRDRGEDSLDLAVLWACTPGLFMGSVELRMREGVPREEPLEASDPLVAGYTAPNTWRTVP